MNTSASAAISPCKSWVPIRRDNLEAIHQCSEIAKYMKRISAIIKRSEVNDDSISLESIALNLQFVEYGNECTTEQLNEAWKYHVIAIDKCNSLFSSLAGATLRCPNDVGSPSSLLALLVSVSR